MKTVFGNEMSEEELLLFISLLIISGFMIIFCLVGIIFKL